MIGSPVGRDDVLLLNNAKNEVSKAEEEVKEKRETLKLTKREARNIKKKIFWKNSDNVCDKIFNNKFSNMIGMAGVNLAKAVVALPTITFWSFASLGQATYMGIEAAGSAIKAGAKKVGAVALRVLKAVGTAIGKAAKKVKTVAKCGTQMVKENPATAAVVVVSEVVFAVGAGLAATGTATVPGMVLMGASAAVAVVGSTILADKTRNAVKEYNNNRRDSTVDESEDDDALTSLEVSTDSDDE